MKNLFCFLAILMSCCCLFAQIPSASKEDAQDNRRGYYSNSGTCSEPLGNFKDGDISNLSNITAGQYCAFLNAVAATDADGLYDERIGWKLEEQNADKANVGAILRSGEPGSYHYEVLKGKANCPINYISQLDTAYYRDWLKNGDNLILLSPSCDQSIKSNHVNFCLLNNTSELIKKNSGRGNTGASLQKIEGIVLGVALLAGGGEEEFEEPEQTHGREARQEVTPVPNANAASSTPQLMMNPSSMVEEGTEAVERILGIGKTTFIDESIGRSAVTDRTDIAKFTNAKPRLLGGGPKLDPTKKSESPREASESSASLSLSMEEALSLEKQFTDAIVAYPDAPRLIVKEGVIMPPDPNFVSNNNDRENQEIMRLLKKLITLRYSSEIVNDISELTPLAFVSARDLSAAKIKEIFERINSTSKSSLKMAATDTLDRVTDDFSRASSSRYAIEGSMMISNKDPACPIPVVFQDANQKVITANPEAVQLTVGCNKSIAESIRRIILRPFTFADIDGFMKWASDNEVTQHLMWDSYQNKREAEAFFSNVVKKHSWFKGIWLDNEVIGSITLEQGKGPYRNKAELGYVLARKHWGKGYVTEATRLVLETGFHDLDIERIEAYVDPTNIGSQKVLEKNGFIKEGLLRKWVTQRGIIKDRYIYSILRKAP